MDTSAGDILRRLGSSTGNPVSGFILDGSSSWRRSIGVDVGTDVLIKIFCDTVAVGVNLIAGMRVADGCKDGLILGFTNIDSVEI
jgi:hypothetical protein